MTFLVDAQLPPALARWLVERGHSADHVADLGMERASDEEVWLRAVAAGATIVTKDEDFAVRRVLADAGPAIVWIRFGNTSTAELLRRLDEQLPAAVKALVLGERIVELT